jgi:Protein kinase domain
MSTEDRTAEDTYAERLLALDEALATGRPVPPIAADDSTPPDLSLRLRRGLRCLQLLQNLRPRAADEAAPTVPIVGTAGPVPPLPVRLGRFEVSRELGRGGCGVVYLAHDPHLGREVALKVPRAEALENETVRQRFHAEAQAAARLDHPNIVTVHEADALGPFAYIASAYCRGETLSRWLARRNRVPVPPRYAVALVRTLALAVQHAHGRGVVHRDLKPSNVLLSLVSPGEERPDDVVLPEESGEARFIPRITDFGLAKLVEGGSDLTHSRVVIGTPEYMAPEQAEGRSRDTGPATDVWALGAILYELLTGRPPFRGDTDLDTLRQIGEDEPSSLRAINREADAGLESVCLKCLEKRSERRYRSAQELADDLDRWLSGRSPRSARWTARAQRAVRRHPFAVAAAVLLALIGASFAGWRYHADPDRQWAAVEKRLDRGDEVRLLTDGQHPAWANFAIPESKAESRTRQGEPVTLISTGIGDPGLMRLAPAMKPPSYHFSAEVRHNRAVRDEGYVGLFFALEEHSTDDGTEYCYLALEFNDLLDEPQMYPGHAGNAARIRLYRHRPTRPSTPNFISSRQGPSHFFPPAFPLAGGEPWHRLAVEVSPEAVRFFVDGAASPQLAMSREDIDRQFRQLGREDRELRKPANGKLRYHPAGGLGLMVLEASASFRNVSIRPLQ